VFARLVRDLNIDVFAKVRMLKEVITGVVVFGRLEYPSSAIVVRTLCLLLLMLCVQFPGHGHLQ
jgi:hypothetical protein